MITAPVYELAFDEYLDRIRRFTDEELIAREPEMVSKGEVPPDLVEKMASLGLFGITLPRRWAGLEWSVEQQVLLTFEFTRASCVYRSRFSTTIGLSSQILLDHGSDAQRERHLAPMARGECVTAFALTEQDAGSDAGAVRTTAVRDGDNYVITGAKRYITNGAWADLLVVFARTGGAGASGVSAFLVPTDTPGVSASLPERMNGHAEAPVAELRFDQVVVPATALVGGLEGTGLRLAMRGINHARIHVAATAVGQATRILDEAARHAATRTQFGRPIGEFGSIEAMLGSSYAELEAGRALVLDCARAFHGQSIPRHRIAAAKYYCTEMASRVADRAVQILGGEGIVGDSPVPRMWRDVRALRIYEGASQIHERNLGRHVRDTATRADGCGPAAATETERKL
ncbi:acyl-CoA dehydrogenase family protein [Rhodococcus sp. NPDC127528]|uniref:acyl-CoA dehydrogenase family protein n=1 Tax=unclassified Rhodococcus (in: high G+C Gram-positive bacteria) TaxID=192944 RepID=UPI0036371768